MSKSSRENCTIRMNPKLKERLQIQAVLQSRHLSDLIEEAAKLYLENLGIQTS